MCHTCLPLPLQHTITLTVHCTFTFWYALNLPRQPPPLRGQQLMCRNRQSKKSRRSQSLHQTNQAHSGQACPRQKWGTTRGNSHINRDQAQNACSSRSRGITHVICNRAQTTIHARWQVKPGIMRVPTSARDRAASEGEMLRRFATANMAAVNMSDAPIRSRRRDSHWSAVRNAKYALR
jgi:hypothetical protein